MITLTDIMVELTDSEWDDLGALLGDDAEFYSDLEAGDVYVRTFSSVGAEWFTLDLSDRPWIRVVDLPDGVTGDDLAAAQERFVMLLETMEAGR